VKQGGTTLKRELSYIWGVRRGKNKKRGAIVILAII